MVIVNFPLEKANPFCLCVFNLFVLLVNVFKLPAQTFAPMPTSLPPPIRMRVRVQEDVFLIPVPQRLVYFIYSMSCYLSE